MRKLFSFAVVFVLGVAACAYVINHYYGLPAVGSRGVVSGPEASRTSPVVARDGANLVADTAAKMGRAVVNINTKGRPVGGLFPGLDIPDFFGLPGPNRPVVPEGQASGVIIRPEGYILTNNHVVADAQSITVTLNADGARGHQERARVVGVDPNSDLAVVKIAPRPGGYPYAQFGNSDSLRVGDWVIAIGNSLGLGTTVTVGVVSATARTLRVEGETLQNAIQTDAAINRGNSGGALADLNNQLVGISTAIASSSPGGGSIGIGFAIPSNSAKRIANELIAHGKVVRPWIGVAYTEITDDSRAELRQGGARNIPRGDGMIIRQVIVGSPADRAGLQTDDVILKVQGKPLKGAQAIVKALEGKKPGDVLSLEVWHVQSGLVSRLTIKLAEMPLQIQR